MPGESKELASQRTAANRVWVNPDGTRTTRAYAAAVHMKDELGEWASIDTSVKPRPDGRLAPVATPTRQDFAADGSDPVLGRIVVDDSHSVGFGLSGIDRSARASVSGSRVTYASAIGSVSLVLTVKPDGIKEELVLPGPGSPTVFDFPLHLAGLAAEVDAETGDVVYRDDHGTERARTPRGFMYEATDARPRPARATSYGVTHSIVTGEAGPVLRTTLDSAWLADPARRWPVVVDPSYWLSTDFQDDTFVHSATTANNAWWDYLPVGSYDVGATRFRSFLNFDITQLTGRTILYAKLNLFLRYSPTCTPTGLGVYRSLTPWSGHTMTSWPGVGYGERVAWANMAMGAPGCPAGWAYWENNNMSPNVHSGILDAVRNWTTAGGWGNFGLVVKAEDESNNWAYKEFDSWDTWGGDPGCPPPCSPTDPGIPHIDIVWNAPPSTPSLDAPGNGAQFHSATPTLSASSSDLNGDAIYYQFELCGPIHGSSQCAASDWTTSGSWQVPGGWLLNPNTESYTWRARAWDGHDPGPTGWSASRGFTVTNAAPTVALQTPTSASVLNTTTLSFAATGGDPDGDTTSYRLQVATGADGHTGRLATSTWMAAPTWTPPAGTFADGGTYYWIAQAQDDRGAGSGWTAPRSFRIDFRLGKRATLPYDTVGPVEVNLSNGNVVLNAAGPSFPTVGGPVRVSFTYNSQTPVVHGLVGDYYQDLDSDEVLDPGEPRLLHRIDPTLTFAWGAPGDGPNPGILKPERWIGRWRGSIRVPPGQDGEWVFVSAGTDDSVVLKANGATKLTATAPGATVQGDAVTLSSTSGTPLDVTYVQVTGPESLRIRIRKASDPAGAEYDIPSDWLTPAQPSLPGGWSRAGDSLVPDAFTAVRPVTGSTTAVVDSDGTDHLYTWTGSSWSPPPGQDGILTQRPDGSWTLEADNGYLYVFGVEGRLESMVSAIDDVRPGVPTYTFGTPNNDGVVRMTAITDAAGRSVTLTYAPSALCPPPPTGFDATAPSNMLCRVGYAAFGGGNTDLYYSNGHLARIVHPGGETADFGYDSTGRLTSVRDALTNDLIAAATFGDPASDRHRTLIEYDSAGRATSVKLPVSDDGMADAQRPLHAYGYTVNPATNHVTQATVRVPGLDSFPTRGNPSRRVALDDAGHVTADTDLAGITDETAWDVFNDRPTRTLDRHAGTAGLVTTRVYDAAGRLRKTHGPALAGEFTGDTSSTAPWTETNYDEGVSGLAAAWYASPEPTGTPKLHTTSAMNVDWGAGSPGTGVPNDRFSGRLTGEVTLPTAGALTLTADGGRVFVDDAAKPDAATGADTWGGPYRSAVAADRPSNYWRLGEAANAPTASDAVGFAAATYSGGVTRGAAGVLTADGDTSATFGGVDGHVAAPAGFDDFTGGLTVEAWVKPSSAGNWARIVDFGNGAAGDNIVFARPGTTNDLHFEVYNGGSPGGYVRAANALVLDTWQHVAATVTPTGAVTIYRDGAAVATGTTAVPRVVRRANNYIGRSNWPGDAYFAGGIDEVALYPSALPAARITAHFNSRAATSSTLTTASIPAGTHRLRVDYQELVGGAALQLTSSASGTTFAPRYGLVTSHRNDEGRWTRTDYATPEHGLATATVLDPAIPTRNPAGTDLRTTTAYEPVSTTGFRRPTSRTLPRGGGTTTTYSYFGIGETADVPCPAGPTGVDQAGAMKTETDPDPDGAGPQTAVVREYRYDRAGRIAAQRIAGDAAWTCTTYDARGRVTGRTDSSGKTQSFGYAQPDRVTDTATDSDNVTRSTVLQTDWLGRPVSYTDEWGTVTRTAYDQAGRVTATFRKFLGAGETQLTARAYDPDTGRLASETEWVSSGPRTTTFGYDAAGNPTTTTRPNGVVTTTGYDTSRGWVSTLSNKKATTELLHLTYGRTAGGNISSEADDTPGRPGRTRTFGYDGAGRLTSVGGTTSRSYAYDRNTNRCARAATCATTEYTYDDADRIQSSPQYSSFAYDAHGNMTQAVPRTQPPEGALTEPVVMTPTTPHTTEFVAGQSGTVSASLDWGPTASPYAAETTTSALTAAEGATPSQAFSIPVDGMSLVAADLTWSQATGTRYRGIHGTVTPDSPWQADLGVTAPGPVEAEVHWTSSSTSRTWSDSVGDFSQRDQPITASADGRITASLTWPSALPVSNLDIELLHAGRVVASAQPTGNSLNSKSLWYDVEALGPYPATRAYTLRVKAAGPGSSYTLASTWPVTADVDLELWRGPTRVAQATGSSSITETLSYNVAAGNTGTYTLKVLSKDHAAPLSPPLLATYPALAHSYVALTLTDPSGQIVSSTGSLSGSVELRHRTISGGAYTLTVRNNTGLGVPSFTLARSTTMQAREVSSGTDVAAGATRATTVSADSEGWLSAQAMWTEGSRAQQRALGGTVGGGSTSDTDLGVAPGTVAAEVDWGASSSSGTWTESVGNLAHRDQPITVSANGTITASLAWPTAVPVPDLDLELLHAGTVVASSAQATGNSKSLSYDVAGLGAYPATRAYTLRVRAAGPGSSYTLASTWPVTADVDLELWRGSTRLAHATGGSSKPETVSYEWPGGGATTLTLRVVSKDHAAPVSGTVGYREVAFAPATLRLKDGSGATLATEDLVQWGQGLEHRVPAAGTYTLEFVNASHDVSIPSFNLDVHAPKAHFAAVLQLKDANGAVVAENRSGDRPKTLSKTVAAGRYSLVVTTTGGSANGTITAGYPQRPARYAVAYDANDHAVSVDDGTTLVSETLSPSGRVIRRSVKDIATQAVAEDVIVGYDGPGDSPAYSRPAAPGGTVTTYLGDVVYTGTTAAWQLANAHGDVVGTTDAAGVFTPHPLADEFGVGQAPADRLGWLGGHKRFAVGGNLGLVRMGVRLYDPSLGRFTSVDPIAGGSANAYDYGFADPVNNFDLDGLETLWDPSAPRYQWPQNKTPLQPGQQFGTGAYLRVTPSVRQRLLLSNPRCVYCPRPATEVDHIIPKLLGGTNNPQNLQPICRTCNASKGARVPTNMAGRAVGVLFMLSAVVTVVRMELERKRFGGQTDPRMVA